MTDKFAALSEGTLVRDALEANLAAGATLNAAGTTDGTVKDLLRPMRSRILIKTPSSVTSTANSATLAVVIEASNDSTFGDTEDVVLAATGTITLTDANFASKSFFLDINSQKRYLRATVTLGGTAPVFTGLTINVVEQNYQRQDGNTANPAQ